MCVVWSNWAEFNEVPLVWESLVHPQTSFIITTGISEPFLWEALRRFGWLMSYAVRLYHLKRYSLGAWKLYLRSNSSLTEYDGWLEIDQFSLPLAHLGDVFIHHQLLYRLLGLVRGKEYPHVKCIWIIPNTSYARIHLSIYKCGLYHSFELKAEDLNTH